MPKIKIETKKTKKLDISISELGAAIANDWGPHEIADLLTEIMQELSYDGGKERQTVATIIQFGFKDNLIAWSKGLPV